MTEQDRYAMAVLADLHEEVMQRVFATGLELQALVDQLPDEALAARVRRCITDLDETLDAMRVALISVRKGTARAG